MTTPCLMSPFLNTWPNVTGTFLAGWLAGGRSVTVVTGAADTEKAAMHKIINAGFNR